MLIFDTYTVDAEKNNFLCKTSIKLFFHSTRYIVYFEKRHYSFIKNVGRLSQTIHQVQISFTTKEPYRLTMWHFGLQSTFLKVCIKPFSFRAFGSPSNKTCLLHQEKITRYITEKNPHDTHLMFNAVTSVINDT